MKTRTASHPASNPSHPDHERWLDGIAPLREAAELRGVHVDTLIRGHAQGKEELLRVSARKWGMRRRHALMLD